MCDRPDIAKNAEGVNLRVEYNAAETFEVKTCSSQSWTHRKRYLLIFSSIVRICSCVNDHIHVLVREQIDPRAFQLVNHGSDE